MTELRPGTTMYRIATLEEQVAELQREISDVRAHLALAVARIGELERHRAPDQRGGGPKVGCER